MTDRQYKIMHITMRFSGGIFTFLQDLTEGLCNDFQQTIIYAAYPNMPQNVRSHFNKKVQLIRLNTYAADHNPLADNQTRNELKDLVAQEKPDIIHLHGYTAGRLGRQAFETLRIPILYTPHGYLYLAEDRNRLSRSLLRRTEQNLSGGNTTTIACSKGEFAETLNFTKNATFINNG
ncbi:MAG: glycosyltransferase, partial [Solobacterium sp.]|nr:glycosyltransferase [Solobacterium sp.]